MTSRHGDGAFAPEADAREPDAPLTRRARDGDVDAFASLLRRYDPAMRRVASRVLGDAAAMDDALQEAYVKAFRALRTYRDDAQFGTWLYRIVYNAAIDELRRARRRDPARLAAQDFELFAPGPEAAVTAADTVRAALATLPEDQRVTVVLVDGEGFDNQAAARLLGVAPGTVASRLSRARAAMRRAIEEADDDRS